MRCRSDGFEAVLVFEHGGSDGYDPHERWLTFAIWRQGESQETSTVEILRLRANDPDKSLEQAVTPLFEEFDLSPLSRQHLAAIT